MIIIQYRPFRATANIKITTWDFRPEAPPVPKKLCPRCCYELADAIFLKKLGWTRWVGLKTPGVHNLVEDADVISPQPLLRGARATSGRCYHCCRRITPRCRRSRLPVATIEICPRSSNNHSPSSLIHWPTQWPSSSRRARAQVNKFCLFASILADWLSSCIRRNYHENWLAKRLYCRLNRGASDGVAIPSTSRQSTT